MHEFFPPGTENRGKSGDGASAPRDRPHGSRAVIVEGGGRLVTGVHDEGTMAGHRFGDRGSRQREKSKKVSLYFYKPRHRRRLKYKTPFALYYRPDDPAKVLVLPPSMACSMIRRAPPRVKAGPSGHRCAAAALTSGVARLSRSAVPSMVRCGGRGGDPMEVARHDRNWRRDRHVAEKMDTMVYSPPFFSWRSVGVWGRALSRP